MNRALLRTCFAGLSLAVGACNAAPRTDQPPPVAPPADDAGGEVLAMFAGHVGPDGTLAFDSLQVRRPSPPGIGVQTAALVDVPVGLTGMSGCSGTTSNVDLDTLASCRDGAACSGFSPCPTGYLCAGVRVWNCYATQLYNVHLKIVTNSAPATYTSANSASELSYLGEGTGALGLWPYGNIASMGSADGRWVFNYPSVGEFTFMGVVKADQTPCTASQTYCSGSASCADLSSDPNNCGTCGTTCSGGTPVCVGGTCAASCSGGSYQTCSGACVDVNTNANACGGSCTACAANQYCNGGSCSTCGGGTTACASATLAGGKQCVDLQSDNDNCGRCGAKCGTGVLYCSSGTCVTGCAAGTFSSASDHVSSCTSCSAGTYSGAGQNSCTSCPAGSYSSSAGQATCTACPVGYAQASLGQTSCSPCSVGTYAASAGQSACSLCAPGTFGSSTALSACSPCAPGTFQSSAGSFSCLNCAANTFAASAGSLTCTPCPMGQTSAPGSASCM